jgi:hypothetical protein
VKKQYQIFFLLLALLLSSHTVVAASAETKAPAASQQNLDKGIQDLKKEVLQLNRDLFLLEEDLLFPANTQFSVFVSIDAGNLFALDSVQLQIDGKVVANYLYTERELQALRRGGIQRLYIGNLASGKHELVAFFTGTGPSKRDYRRGTTLEFEKTTDPEFVELKIIDNKTKEQPDFKVKVWE